MSKINMDKSLYEKNIPLILDYMEKEFNLSFGEFEAQFLLDFVIELFADHYYNQGVEDAISKLHTLMGSVEDEIDLLRIL